MKVLILGNQDSCVSEIEEMKKKIADTMDGVEVIVSDTLPEGDEIEKLDLVIDALVSPEEKLIAKTDELVKDFMLRPQEDFDMEKPGKFKPRKEYRSKKDRRNHR